LKEEDEEGLDAARLRRTATAVSNGRGIDNGIEIHTGNLQTTNGLLATGADALYFDLERLNAKLLHNAHGLLGGNLLQ
jgi:hypothetical protein